MLAKAREIEEARRIEEARKAEEQARLRKVSNTQYIYYIYKLICDGDREFSGQPLVCFLVQFIQVNLFSHISSFTYVGFLFVTMS